MRIGVNAVPLRVSGGGARYVFTELMDRLLTLDTRNEYVIFAHYFALPVVHRLLSVHPHLCPQIPSHRRVRLIEVGCEEDIFQHRDSFDLFFGPLNNLQPRIYDRPSVAILHDIQEQFIPENFKEPERLARYEIYPEICKASTILVTISEFCKQSIVEKFGIDPAKIEVIYNAPQTRLVDRPADDNGAWPRGTLPERFFFYPANCYHHKNHALLLDALARLRKKTPNCPACVFTGFELPNGFALRDEIHARGLGNLCHVFDEVHVDELRHLFRNALAMVMPTRFEGFGMPVAEALACGCPVICSDLPVLHEVAGDAATYFDPDAVDDLVAQLRRAAIEPMNPEQRAGLPRAVERFNWEHSARRYVELFEEAPHRFFGFTPQRGQITSDEAPRIGILISAPKGSHGVSEAVRSVVATGYDRATILVETVAANGTHSIADLLGQLDVPVRTIDTTAGSSWRRLATLADEHNCDLVLELIAGHNLLTPTALHSLAWAYQNRRDCPLFLGEAWETEQGRIGRTARLRRLGTGDWKLDGFIYPEMLAVAPPNFATWPGASQRADEAGDDWRWQLVKEAHRTNRLEHLRRTLAVCDPACIPLATRMRAIKSGSCTPFDGDGTPQPESWLRRLEPILRPMSRALPPRWRDKGKRIWRHLADER